MAFQNKALSLLALFTICQCLVCAFTPVSRRSLPNRSLNLATSRITRRSTDLKMGVKDPSKIRNFSIIAHIDHGKSTLADRLLEITDTVQSRDMQSQLLDSMDIERERGITIKLQAARMEYTALDGESYVLNLIDTPGHVDFTYEVSRSLAACEGAILVVDASQGVEAQTLANVYLALENDLEVIPVLNKIDLPAADPDRVSEEVEQTVGLDCRALVLLRAGLNVSAILEEIVKRVPPPAPATGGPLKALIFDSYYDPYKGVVVFFRVVDGEVRKGDRVRFLFSGKDYEATEVGVMSPKQRPIDVLQAGEVGYLAGAIKSVEDARVGDTITLSKGFEQPLPGYSEAVPMVYCGLFPTEATSTRRCARRWASCGSTTPRSATSLRARARWGSGSAAGSWACCTWRSCRSGSSASTTWTSSSPRPRWSTK
ncbi:unnamed protein product [Heterosigma akashiwo]